MQIKALLAGMILVSGHVLAANVPQDWIDFNIKACEKMQTSSMLSKESYHPDAAHLTSYCTCTTETYFRKLLPESEWQEMNANPARNLPVKGDSPEEVKAKRERMKATGLAVHERQQKAEAACH
jgi:hypothetical protein